MIFSYPLDDEMILRKKRSFKRKLLESQQNFLEKKIAILGGSSTHEVREILELFLLDGGIKPCFYESEYNRFYEDAVFDNQALLDFDPDIIYIHTSIYNLQSPSSASKDFWYFETHQQLKDYAKNTLNYYESIWREIQRRYKSVIIQNNFELPSERNFGNFDAIKGKVAAINMVNSNFAEQIAKFKGVYLQDICYLSAQVGLDKWFDNQLYYQAKYAMSMQGIVALAFNLSRIIFSIFGKSKKVLALDLDNTCWGGVIGDDGLGGIVVGDETALGEAYSAFQSYVRSLKDRGIVLAVCSKNEFDNAKEGFVHPRSELKFDDFSAFYANWNPKHENLQNMAYELSLGTDSFVFVDDNPSEREIVRINLPQVSVPEVGDDITHFIKHIDRNRYFESISIGREDLMRVQSYADNAKRIQAQNTFKNYDDFLQSLEMRAEIQPFSPIYLDRITQLINKTNQFNLTTKRFDFSEVKALSEDKDVITLYGKLEDKFGDNGLIAISVGKIIEGGGIVI